MEAPRCQASVQRFTRAVESLSSTEQNLFQLNCDQEIPVKELAEMYGLTLTAARRRLRRIHHKLEQSNANQLAS